MKQITPNPTVAKIQATPEGATIVSLIEAADLLKENVNVALKKVGLSHPKYDVLSQLADAGESLSFVFWPRPAAPSRTSRRSLIGWRTKVWFGASMTRTIAEAFVRS
jgi:hypothetical protein